MRVLKFGGTSVADADAIQRLVAIVRRERASDSRPGMLVVVSALSGVTDRLLALAELARRGESALALESLETLRARHREVTQAVADGARGESVQAWLDEHLDHLGAALKALSVLHELPPRFLDAFAAAGELLSSPIIAAALEAHGIASTWVDPRRLIVTDDSFTSAVPYMAETIDCVAAEVGPCLANGHVAVTGGYVGATRQGITTTLGRGGSDYSASILGAALTVDEIQIWTDVDGMLTADPRVFPLPRLVHQLSFGEAAELAYFGAKVLHPKTIQPALARAIPVRILNSRHPDGTGTLITADPARASGPVAAFACKRNITVIDVTSTGMLEAHGYLRRLFEVFERNQTSVDVVTTSEVSVSITIDDRRRLGAIVAELSQFAEVAVDEDMALIGIVGDSLQADPGTFGRIVLALGRVPLKLVSQAASRRNITLVLAETDLPGALARLHDEFFGDAVTIGDGSGRAADTHTLRRQ
jgi:aspartate kinase